MKPRRISSTVPLDPPAAVVGRFAGIAEEFAGVADAAFAHGEDRDGVHRRPAVADPDLADDGVARRVKVSPMAAPAVRIGD